MRHSYIPRKRYTAITRAHSGNTTSAQSRENAYKVTAQYLRQYERNSWRIRIERPQTSRIRPLSRIAQEVYEGYMTHITASKHAQKKPLTLARYIHQYRRDTPPMEREEVILHHARTELDHIQRMRKVHAVLELGSRIVLRTE